MKAALYRGFGAAADVLSVVDIDVPDPAPGQVRVKITRSGINPTDWKARAGSGRGLGNFPFQIPHHDGAGVIDALGQGVDDLHVGQRVWLFGAAAENPYGTAAEYCVVPAYCAIPLPDNASDDLGACLGVPAGTATQCLGADQSALAGTTVLAAGGAGAVGHYAIELARYAGARVVTTVSSEEKAKLARDAGADLIVNYRDDDAIDQVRGFAERIDRIVEVSLGANLELDLAVAGPGTVIAVYAREQQDPLLPFQRLMTANATIRYVLLYTVAPAELLSGFAWINDALAASALTALPITAYPLDEIVAAHEAAERGVVGKIVLIP
ncbi:MAG TPA: NADPH:quinone reductase [Pseudonocardia sp.]